MPIGDDDYPQYDAEHKKPGKWIDLNEYQEETEGLTSDQKNEVLEMANKLVNKGHSEEYSVKAAVKYVREK